MKVTLTFKGENAYKSFCGGIVTLVVFTAILVQAILVMKSTASNPNYMTYPQRKNYDYNQTMTLEPKYNMISIKIVGSDLDQKQIDENLRVVFSKSALGSHFPAIPCHILFAEEMKEEAEGRLYSNFFTKTYSPSDDYEWICPYIENSYDIGKAVSSNIRANVVQCKVGKLQDPSWSTEDCLTPEETLENWSTNAYNVYIQTTSTNFVPSQYHDDKSLQMFSNI